MVELEIDGGAPELAAALDKRGKRYRKAGQFRAIRAARETPVKTVLADGTNETQNIAEPGDYIVTGMGASAGL